MHFQPSSMCTCPSLAQGLEDAAAGTDASGPLLTERGGGTAWEAAPAELHALQAASSQQGVRWGKEWACHVGELAAAQAVVSSSDTPQVVAGSVACHACSNLAVKNAWLMARVQRLHAVVEKQRRLLRSCKELLRASMLQPRSEMSQEPKRRKLDGSLCEASGAMAAWISKRPVTMSRRHEGVVAGGAHGRRMLRVRRLTLALGERAGARSAADPSTGVTMAGTTGEKRRPVQQIRCRAWPARVQGPSGALMREAPSTDAATPGTSALEAVKAPFVVRSGGTAGPAGVAAAESAKGRAEAKAQTSPAVWPMRAAKGLYAQTAAELDGPGNHGPRVTFDRLGPAPPTSGAADGRNTAAALSPTSWTPVARGPREAAAMTECRTAMLARAPSGGIPCRCVVRSREARSSLRAFDCEQCRRFHSAVDKLEGREACGTSTRLIALRASRHRFEHTPAHTPPGFWDLSFPIDAGKVSQPQSDAGSFRVPC